ncbi:unnamed protein product [Rhizoctonia solani]|uniref:Nephrocystin 3-like N-terminal domain-containing protein n=1 Tax=Rhizoctonia solani TaxID=456999 RepID=A0A8H3HJC7_9AGAM|nr:unnamed protein product [Rhizoctonia solani]
MTVNPDALASFSNQEFTTFHDSEEWRPRSLASAAWDRLISSLSAFESSAGLFPPLKSAVGELIGCLDAVEAAASNRTDYEELTSELQSMADMLNQYAGELDSEFSNGSIANIAQCIRLQVEGIQQQQQRGTVGRLLDATQDQEDVIKRYRQVERLFRQLQCDVTMRTRSDVKEHIETARLRGMSPVDDARYNSIYSTTIKRHGCTAETREAIQQSLKDWVANPNSEKIYWMNGMAGTGKTTIAYSFCEWLRQTNRLGASFFCSRISSTCRSLGRIIPTLAYQLARYSPAFRAILCAALKDDPDAGTLNVGQQFEKLMYLPISKAKNAIPDGVVIVIDALDECDDTFSVQLLLDVLLKFAEHLPLKFFVASRPEHVIRERMMSQGGTARSIVHLHDIEQSIVEADIKKYLTDALHPMTPPPTPKQIDTLAKRAGKLFIYAATVVRYINPGTIPVESSFRLETILMETKDPEAEADSIYEDLDRLYTTVLNAVFSQSLVRKEKECMKRVLWTVVCAREPILASTLASLATLTEAQVWSALQSLRSVLHVPENNGLISTLHASFPEYMLDPSRSKDLQCNEVQWNTALVQRCFEVMQSDLRFNICNLQSSYLTNAQVVDLETRVAACISPSLSYACRYWAQHLSSSTALVNIRDMLLDFLPNRLLFWMEVLSLSGGIRIGASMMQQVQTWLRHIGEAEDGIQKQVADVRNFVTWFAANPCSRSTPHIYISALPLCIKSSWVYQQYWQRTKGLANIEMSQQDGAVLAIWSTGAVVYSMAISPDGDRIAVGSADGSIHVYDIHTGAIISGSFKGHTRDVSDVEFSPDGTQIVSCSPDKTVIIWDSHSGSIVHGPLHGHTDWISSVAFSPDGNRVVSGSDDQTVIVWDIHTGAIVLGPLQGHTDRVFSVAFSPDNQLIASCSGDHTIRLWDAYTGAAKAEPLKGHSGEVNGVAFSPNGSQLVSCSDDKTIRVWDTQTGTAIGQPFEGHKSRIWTVAFSSDGTYIVSGGLEDDGTIMVWETRTGSVVLGPLHGHTSVIQSVGFLPDDSRVVSCSSDKTIRIWDVQSKHGQPNPPGARETPVGPIMFSLDNTQFVSNSSSGALRIWDTSTGASISPPFKGQADFNIIHSVAFSPQGSHVVTGANDFSIRVWDVLTGDAISQPLKGHQGPIRCIVFSPDGTHICSGSEDFTARIWDIKAGVMIGQPYEGHTGSVQSVSYSPDGTQLASGSADYTVRVWNVSTSTLVHTLSEHESSVLSVAFSPDGSHIVSGSTDGRVYLWNTHDLKNPVSRSYDGRVDSVCFSPDDTYIIVGCGSTVHVVDTQIMQSISTLELSWKDEVRWVGCSSNGTDILSVSTLRQEGAEESTEEPTQQHSQRPNIVRVWRAGRPEQAASSSTERYWSYKPDGRILSPEGFVIWVPPDLLPYLKYESKTHYNPLIISPDGIIDIGYKDLCIGERWAECYIQKDSAI